MGLSASIIPFSPTNANIPALVGLKIKWPGVRCRRREFVGIELRSLLHTEWRAADYKVPLSDQTDVDDVLDEGWPGGNGVIPALEVRIVLSLDVKVEPAEAEDSGP